LWPLSFVTGIISRTERANDKKSSLTGKTGEKKQEDIKMCWPVDVSFFHHGIP
jgi:hypothetical protein